mmetsp:Transcript_102972/g.297761  ORF Transcript_102972/g.297761 Transcript_102972/m.297761 type:complete len:245 (+) Transcript_102972:695-1429(+)
MRIDETILALEIQICDSPFVQELEGQRDGADIELRLLSGQEAQHLERVQQLAARYELHQEVHVLLAPECPDELDDERVVQLGQDAPLRDDVLLLLRIDSLLDADALQCVPRLRLCGAHHLYDAEAACADDPHAPQRLDLHLRVLKRHPILHVLEDRPLDGVPECRGADLPQFRILLRDDCGASGLRHQQRPLAHVITNAQSADLLLVDTHLQKPAVDDKELVSLGPPLEDDVASGGVLDDQRVC